MRTIYLKSFEAKPLADNADSLLLVYKSKPMLLNDLRNLAGGSYSEFAEIYDEDKDQYFTSDDIEFIDSLIGLDFNNKRNLSALTKQLKKLYGDELTKFAQSETIALSSFSEKITVDYSLPLETDIELKAEDILRQLNLHFCQKEDTLLESLIDYMKISIELRGCQLFIFHHLLDYLEEKELKDFLYEVKLLNVLLLDLESRDFESIFDHRILLDSDLCTLI